MGADAVTALVGVLVPLLAAGAAYGGVRAGLHGCRQSLDDMSRVVERLDARLDAHSDRLTRLEVETSHLKAR